MREIVVTADVSGNTPPVVLDQYLNPASVTYYKSGAGGTVQVSVTDPYPVVNQNFVAPTFTWVTAPTTAPNAANFLGQPYRAIRLSGATAGDTLTVVQAGAK
jgi:hypothetical protein